MAFGETIVSNPNYGVLQKTASYTKGEATMLAGTNTVTIDIPSATEDSTVLITLDPNNIPLGFWNWESRTGEVIVSSDRVETANVTFGWDLFQSAALAADVQN